MADDKHYVPGDFYRMCDRTGFKVRAGRTQKEWTGMIVRGQSWERRHPQDFVRGVRDDQTVPMPRPRQVDLFIAQSSQGAGIEVYGDLPGLPGTTFLVENQMGPSYNTGINADSNFMNAGGTAMVRVYNGTIPPVSAANFPKSG